MNNLNFEQIFREYNLYIYNYALKLVCNPQTAEDLTQQTFMTAFEKQNQLQEEGALKKWLTTICYRHFLMYLRSSGACMETPADMEEMEMLGASLPDAGPEPEEEVIVGEEISALQNGCFLAMVRRLTLRQRIAFSLVDMFGMSIADAAELLELSPNAMKGLLHRARLNLDSFFGNHCNLLDAKNPCSCQAWIRFRDNHEQNKKAMKISVEMLDYRKTGYKFDEHIRAKIYYLYRNMPDRKPSSEWYENVIANMRSN